MSTTAVTRYIAAPRALVYRAMLDPDAIRIWRVPNGMTSQIHEFDAREGGRFRISLTYDAPDAQGKSGEHTDTYHGRFVQIVASEKIVEAIEFETSNPAMQGEMTITYTLADARLRGTDVSAVHEGVPPGVKPADNELGWRMSFDNLAAYVETGAGQPRS
jgi:uncharacterized protein YndB with AHSA1/START domain